MIQSIINYWNYMKHVCWSKINELATRAEGKFSVYISNGLNYDETDSHIWKFVCDEIIKFTGGINDQYHDITSHLIGSNGGLFFFDTEEEGTKFYSIFEMCPVYSSAIYAGTYCPIRGPLTENT